MVGSLLLWKGGGKEGRSVCVVEVKRGIFPLEKRKIVVCRDGAGRTSALAFPPPLLRTPLSAQLSRGEGELGNGGRPLKGTTRCDQGAVLQRRVIEDGWEAVCHHYVDAAPT